MVDEEPATRPLFFETKRFPKAVTMGELRSSNNIRYAVRCQQRLRDGSSAEERGGGDEEPATSLLLFLRGQEPSRAEA